MKTGEAAIVGGGFLLLRCAIVQCRREWAMAAKLVTSGGSRSRQAVLMIAAAALLAACGGSDIATVSGGSATCDVATEKSWLRSYMADRYFWAGQAANPDPAPYASVADYFEALRYRPDPAVTTLYDAWSYIADRASYYQFFAEGRAFRLAACA